ncbi:hypothetical protein [Aciditerrimonas ferrireducens]|uniref:hypothetical protein n=1 Tax=Aciditerrimonas ferrireducens TaxID=667306 RepID=UPI0020063E1A|nr:hypothetical protein [Aciditerrimonas ferrireducens]MCK4176326.1 hypothetical protein [Aciditerrimonas ferrireducens]
MALDPRTPVLVGAAQVTNRPGAPRVGGLTPRDGLEVPPGVEPVELAALAAQAAFEDTGAGARLRGALGSLRMVRPLSWHYRNAPLLLARRIGLAPSELVQSTIGGNSPVALTLAAAEAIAAGHHDVVLVAGAECTASRLAHRRAHDGAEPPWTTQGPDTPEPRLHGVDRPGSSEEELAVGLGLPIHVYPLFEEALRAAAQRDQAAHQQLVGQLWARFSTVAARHPFAWDPTPRSAEQLITPGPANRLIATPYTRHLVAYDRVDQAAALVLCSLDTARAAGVPEDRWVFPLAGAEATDHWFVSERPELHRSPAIAACGQALFAHLGLGVDDLAHFDLYSCFPSAVQIAASELGLDPFDPRRDLTVTGGLTFFGGPLNDYAAHSLVTMAHRLRQHPGDLGLVSGLGWFVTKHALSIWSTRPPERPFALLHPQQHVDQLPRQPQAPNYQGPATIEVATVVHDRQGQPERAVAAVRTPTGQRAWAQSTHLEVLAGLLQTDPLRQPCHVQPGRELRLA